ncbi:hypothetical protein JAAARDRAFT_32076 [Jaapia argillacea MUCL 33604]|uniref:Activator of Hsp90 ATPase AHSA1-like N-terminal domain-containing protein n=1 Tax=Jaapia argillacea MUCL 33604 TaxID=933084 RepID=A0A067Q286_9AGAM|nr:hypothetical protein JAAARDRAFT_32076 [Jaapia argillacea MUCL 33604]
MSSMPLSTANWHWKNKNVTPWAKTWFETELTTLSVQGEGEEVVLVSKVTDVDGDVELGQRKSKLITIFDVKIDLEWTGTASDGTEVSGKLTVPEVSHENTLDQTSNIHYDWSLTTAASPPVTALYTLARSRLPTALETKFAEFAAAIMEIHGKDIQVSAANSRVGTPAPGAASSSNPVSKSGTATPVTKEVKKKKEGVSTTKVNVDATFMASGDDLFGLLTDEKRIPLWSRNVAQSSGQPGSEYSLFGGGVKGKYVSVTPGKEVVQTWALSSPSWPSGHEATLTTTFDQKTDSTTIKFSLDGVPVGMEDEITRNLEGYYVQGLKSIGYVHIVPPHPSQFVTPSWREPPTRNGFATDSSDAPPSSVTGTIKVVAIAVAVLTLVAAFAIPYFSS